MALGVGGKVKYAEKTGERGTDSGVEDEGQRVPSGHSLWCLGTAVVLGVSVGLDHGCCLNT